MTHREFPESEHPYRKVSQSKRSCNRNEYLRDVTGSDNAAFANGVLSGGEYGTVNTEVVKVPAKTSKQKSLPERLVEKDGKRNVKSKHIPRERYMQDVFTTLVDAKWKWVIMLFITVYVGQWIVFAFIWWIVVLAHGRKCVDNVTGFVEAFLFSLETSMTIGYGGRAVTSKCSEGVIILMLQALLSSLIDAVIIGMIFTKLARPGKRQTTVIFSENAVITKRDDKFCLMFRVADVRKKQLSECHIRLYLYRTYKTLEGKIIRHHQDQLRVGCDWYNIRDDSDRLFLLPPCTVTHVMDRKSPFFNVTPERYASSDWELVVVLEGVVEATGSTMQTRTSFIPSEVCWGYDFDEVAECPGEENDGLHRYRIDNLNNLILAPYVPRCSPMHYYTQIDKEPDPNDVYGEQDELWDDTNFIEPREEDRVLESHKHLTEDDRNVVT